MCEEDLRQGGLGGLQYQFQVFPLFTWGLVSAIGLESSRANEW